MFQDNHANLWADVPPACHLCGGPSRPFFAVEPSRYSFSTNVRPTIIRCTGCGLAWVNPRLAEVAPAQAEAAAAQERRVEGPPESERERAHDVLTRIERHERPGHLLDIGCGYGYLLQLATERGWQAVGVNPNAREAQYARAEMGVAVPARIVEEAGFPDASFDVVSLVEVLEHLADPVSVLSQANRVLRPGGLLYLQTPDLDCVEARLLKRRWVMLYVNSHWFFYSDRPLRQLLQRTGFRVVERPLWARGRHVWGVPLKFALGLLGFSSLTSITVIAQKVGPA